MLSTFNEFAVSECLSLYVVSSCLIACVVCELVSELFGSADLLK